MTATVFYDDIAYYMAMSRIVGEAPEELLCARCKIPKSTSEFPVVTARGKKRYSSYCTDCINGYARDFRSKDVAAFRQKANLYYQANAERKRELARRWRANAGVQRAYNLRSQYGISLDDYQVLLDKQQGVCAVCKKPPQGKRKFLAVDHDHQTGKIRGLLCTTCNVGLGALQDNPDLLRAALVYLEGDPRILVLAERAP